MASLNAHVNSLPNMVINVMPLLPILSIPFSWAYIVANTMQFINDENATLFSRAAKREEADVLTKRKG